MRLKRLEMVGFKSFADKTRVEFEPGVTGVVGPNGCGKSNISDAVRWALGEMSAKSLRSGHMLDVIFNGTATRPALGLSEVSLTFDNSSRQIPLDYSEVTISRRLFRSGESEYFINKTQCRLKDVRELFLDTGVGNDGYYVMAQGKIEFILSSKPEERRELFEEAAGVSKYNARREEALRRLAKVDQDMLRLNDSLAIYKQQMDTLETAVRKARQHQKLQEDLRKLEIASLVHGYARAQADWESVSAVHSQESERFVSSQATLAEKESSLSQARTRAETMEQQLIDLQKRVADCETEWARTEAERRSADERKVELTTLQERLAAEAVTLENQLQESREAQTQLLLEVEALRAEYGARRARFEEENEKGRADQESAQAKQRELDSGRSRVLELARLISHHRNETVRLTSLSIRHDESSKAKQRELEKVQVRRAAVSEQIQQQAQQAEETRGRLEAARSALQRLDEQQAADQKALLETAAEVQLARERRARLQAEKVSLERWLSQDPVALATAALQERNLPGVHGPVSSLMTASGTYQRLLDRALGDRAHWFIADSFNHAQAAVRFLSEERKGWATFMILDRIPSVEPSIPHLDDAASRSLALQVNCDLRFRPVQDYLLSKTYFLGATLFEELTVRGGSDPIGESFQATPTDLNRLLNELTMLEENLEAGQQRQENLRAQISQRHAERGPMSGELEKINVLTQVQQQGLNRLHDENQMTIREEEILLRERDISLQAIEETKRGLQQEETLLATLESEQLSLHEALQSSDVALQELRQVIQAHQAQVSQLRLEAETMRERLVGVEREEQNAQKQAHGFEQRLNQIKIERDEAVERFKQQTIVLEQRATRLGELQLVRSDQQTQMVGLLEERQAFQQGLHSQESELGEARNAVSQAQSAAQEAEFQTRTLDQDRNRMEQSLRDLYQMSMSEARQTNGDTLSDPEELARVRRRLESMGAVNLAAPEEHSQLEQRYQFLQTQQQDLQNAKNDLHQAIQKINLTTREHFKTTFEQVRQNFKMLYQTLFQGGEADLVLTDQQDLLSSGIDIIAQPPGKKTQSITLLSGGERALTAIALLFAFFMVKPSPFCLLDEVDAPLDEANVGRFLRMVKSFAEKTQFIVITHNKRTMEMADILYGVTMAQLGVSSLISVKMEARKPADVAA